MKKINLISVRAKDLTKKQILLICKLKNSFWTRTVPDQLKWFKKNVKKMDINNMLIIDGNVVGYTLLRRRSAYIENRRISYFYFDTFLVRSDLRKKGLGETLMIFNNKIIKSFKRHSFLICKRKLISFYVKFNWKILPGIRFKMMDHKPAWLTIGSNVNGMNYNFNKKIKKKIIYYIN
tara:strand:+ start:436 stop:969 length:534 start_codon:yes stop_codon:yes gene_type:complete